MTLLKKPKRENFSNNGIGQLAFDGAERDYYKNLSEIAIAALQRIDDETEGLSSIIAVEALESIRQTAATHIEEPEPPCIECGQRGCNGECMGDGLMGG